ncbi:MAG TPA: asparagine synthase-related protein [Candidatus Acidoferrales bacterium]|nr:asparagine synthase-related protein [Candidatus Acidoferrales bacterium]
MSVQFGRWSFNDLPAAPEYIDKAAELLAPYGPDGGGRYSGPGVDIIYRGFHTTRESRRERQPHQLASGAVLTWDGRLDNREELIRQLHSRATLESADVEIAAAAYEQWGTKCFAKLIGDWALSVWNPRDHELILAKDFLGTRHLYYAADQEQVVWSTILDPLVLLAGKTFELEEEYIAGWLAFFPAAHLTPYVGIHAVPPSTFLCLRPGKETATKYWDFDPHKQTRYVSESEYEEHFRTVFGESVRRRLRSDAPVLAELSGGMDSSSIVCMADRIIAQSIAETSRLDTVSYYDDSEPNWNERPYFTQIEEQRGRVGCHIDVSSKDTFHFGSANGSPAASPGAGAHDTTAEELVTCMIAQGNRIVLSGVGGDEVFGGVPTAIPELSNLLSRCRFRTLVRQLKLWTLNKRSPWFHLFFDVLRGFLPPSLAGVPTHVRPAPWVQSSFVKRHRTALTGYPHRITFFGSLPSFQENLSTLEGLRRQLQCAALFPVLPYENRYPCLDRDLLEFVYAIPREQLVRPGQRRSLMRRALSGIVPPAVLSRRRKAFVRRSSMRAISADWTSLENLMLQTANVWPGIFETKAFRESLQKARQGEEVPIVGLLRSIYLAAWLWNMPRSKPSNRRADRRHANDTDDRACQHWRAIEPCERDSIRLG